MSLHEPEFTSRLALHYAGYCRFIYLADFRYENFEIFGSPVHTTSHPWSDYAMTERVDNCVSEADNYDKILFTCERQISEVLGGVHVTIRGCVSIVEGKKAKQPQV